MTTHNLTKALREWLDAQEAYKELSQQYIAVGAVLPGQPIKAPRRVLNEEAFELLRAAEQRVDETHTRYLDVFRTNS